jgi:hypothetical protein
VHQSASGYGCSLVGDRRLLVPLNGAHAHAALSAYTLTSWPTGRGAHGVTGTLNPKPWRCCVVLQFG